LPRSTLEEVLLKSAIALRKIARPLFLFLVLFAGTGALVPLAAADQQESYTFTLALFAGVGGGVDAEPDAGLTESSYLLQAGMITEPRTLVSVRAGSLKLEGDEGFDRFLSADLEFVNVAGEYRIAQSYYDYGLYLGVGYYSLEGDLRTGGSDRESDLGLALGITGDFDITRHLSVVGEVSAHYAFLDSVAIYTMAHIGLAVHF